MHQACQSAQIPMGIDFCQLPVTKFGILTGSRETKMPTGEKSPNPRAWFRKDAPTTRVAGLE